MEAIITQLRMNELFYCPNKICSTRRNFLHNAFSEHLSSSLRVLLKKPDGINSDKFFSTKWLDSSSVILGSKDSKIIAWNILTPSKSILVPLPYSVSRKEKKGIYSISINPKKDEFAVSSYEDIVTYSLPSFCPNSLLRGHVDSVFGIKYLTENYIISGGKDGTIRIWNTYPKNGTEIQSLISRREHKSKVRAIATNRISKRLVSVSPDNTINVWDLNNLDVINVIHPRPSDDMVCTTHIDKGFSFVVGSMDSLIFIDIRIPNVVSICPIKDPEGIRAVTFKYSTIITGGASGYVDFFDIRKMNYLESKGPNKIQQSLTSKEGPLKLKGFVV